MALLVSSVKREVGEVDRPLGMIKIDIVESNEKLVVRRVYK